MLHLPLAIALLAAPPEPVTLRIATFDLSDVRTTDLLDNTTPRLKQIAEVIQRLRPNIILLNELAYDMPGAPGFKANDNPGRNARRFLDQYLNVPQVEGLAAMKYQVFTDEPNSGVASGLDLDHDGAARTETPAPPPRSPEGLTDLPADTMKYAADCWGPGAFPGQYGMALLVDARLPIVEGQIRTFRRIPWDYMPAAYLPKQPDGRADFFTKQEKDVARLSSRGHWDVPISLPNGAVLHVLASHPTSPRAGDAAAQRNHDEIRFWADYIECEEYVVDDKDHGGGLPLFKTFVILGDLNADPAKSKGFKDPITEHLIKNPKIKGDFTPRAEESALGLADTDTCAAALRLDYVLPSADCDIIKGGIWRQKPAGAEKFPSEHFPVWLEVKIPSPTR